LVERLIFGLRFVTTV